MCLVLDMQTDSVLIIVVLYSIKLMDICSKCLSAVNDWYSFSKYKVKKKKKLKANNKIKRMILLHSSNSDFV